MSDPCHRDLDDDGLSCHLPDGHAGVCGQPRTVTLPRFMAYDEGCYECGEPSGVIGFYGTRDEAQTAVQAAEERQRANWHGQHDMFVIDLTAPTMSEHAS